MDCVGSRVSELNKMPPILSLSDFHPAVLSGLIRRLSPYSQLSCRSSIIPDYMREISNRWIYKIRLLLIRATRSLGSETW